MLGFGDGQVRFVKSIEMYNRGANQFNNQHWGRAYLNFRRATAKCIGRARDVGGFYQAAASREIRDPVVCARLHRRSLEFYKRGVAIFPDATIFAEISREYAALAKLSCSPDERRDYADNAARYARSAATGTHPSTNLVFADAPWRGIR